MKKLYSCAEVATKLHTSRSNVLRLIDKYGRELGKNINQNLACGQNGWRWEVNFEGVQALKLIYMNQKRGRTRHLLPKKSWFTKLFNLKK